MIIRRKLNQCFIWKYSLKQLRPAEGPMRQEQPCSSAVARTFYSEGSLRRVIKSFALCTPFPRASHGLQIFKCTAQYRELLVLLFWRGLFSFHSSPSLLPFLLNQPAWEARWPLRAGGWSCCVMAVLAAGWRTCATTGWLVKEEITFSNLLHSNCFWKNNCI